MSNELIQKVSESITPEASSNYQEEYEVVVYKRVKEVHSVMAGSEAEALKTWEDGHLASIESVEILSESVIEGDCDEDW